MKPRQIENLIIMHKFGLDNVKHNLSKEALMVIDNMQHIIDELLLLTEEQEQALRECDDTSGLSI